MKRFLAVLSVAVMLSAASCSASPTEGNLPSSSLPGVEQPEATAAVESPLADLALNDRGNVVGVLGQVEPVATSSGSQIGEFTVTGISTGQCEDWIGIGASESAHGRIVLVEMKINMEPVSENPDNSPIYTTAGGTSTMAVLTGDGTTWNGDVSASSSCLPDDKAMPAYVNAGDSRVGVVAIDIPLDSSVLIYRPTADMGYEFDLPR